MHYEGIWRIEGVFSEFTYLHRVRNTFKNGFIISSWKIDDNDLIIIKGIFSMRSYKCFSSFMHTSIFFLFFLVKR